MDNQKILEDFASIFSDEDFKELKFRTNDIDFSFKSLSNVYQKLVTLLDSLNIEHQTLGLIVNASAISRDSINRLYANYESLFFSVYNNSAIATTSILIVVNLIEGYVFDSTNDKENFKSNGNIVGINWMNNYRLYASLLKLFKTADILVEFDDAIKQRLMIIDNSKDQNNATISYQIFDPRIFTKPVSFNLDEIEGRINDSAKPNNSEWLSIFRHNIVGLITAQELSNKSFTEFFLNLNFILQNTNRDYTIYLSGFSFDKISKEMKSDRQKYFSDLYQTQDKIKSQVIAVPLAVGTSIYAFFQLNITTASFFFLLLAIGIYISFIWWYLFLYERDLNKLKADIDIDSSKFQSNYPTIYSLFESDFKYITEKILSVKLLSLVIRSVTLIDWLLLASYVIFFHKEKASLPQYFFVPKYVLMHFYQLF
jgi:hypothetical protein